MTAAAAGEIDQARAVEALLRDALADPETAFSLGSFGALAEFMRDPDEQATDLTDGRLGIATSRGGVAFAFAPGLRPVAYETAFESGWNHAVALCLPEDACAMTRRTVVTELGPDRDAVREADRGAILFDLGLGLAAVDACIRTADPDALDALRSGVGKPLFDPGNPIGPRLVALSPHRVFIARIGRVEVFQPIPPADGRSPDGPHTHVIPKLLRSGRTHAATTPVPVGYVPVAAIHPPHPYKDMMGRRIPFRRERYDAFQALLDAWGDPSLLAVKRGTAEPKGKHAQMARRAGENQARWLAGEVPEGAPEAFEAKPEEQGGPA